MSFSIAKSYLSTLAGVAVARGLIRDLDDRVSDSAADDGFASAQNRGITWRHLLQQTSEWSGTLFGKPDSIDHNRDVGKLELGGADKGVARAMRPPGTLWEYNDVRVNRLGLSLLQLFRRPLADVLRESVMVPIGASSTWQWQPYDNAWVDIDGTRMPSVPGGSHWGGGLWMSTRDHARFGLLHLQRGRWNEREILPASWIDEIRRPCPLNPAYGLLWWLDAGCPGAYAARGAGSNIIWIVPDLDVVAVVRWIHKPHVEGVLTRLLDAISR
jgi:CubicO group peptidase (beta-lactamase class C family)